jgi:NAD(P)-dependent dehydrogenase (short-subunit alcohol dehydrogenase family)
MNKIVLITGATGALGRATALEIAKTGATTILCARNKNKLENLKREISRNSVNDNIDILVADFSDSSSVKNAVMEFKQKYNRLDALLNIAAVYKSKREITRDKLELMFATNHLAPFILTNELLELLKAGKPSRIVTVSAPSTTKLHFEDLQGEKKFSSWRSFGGSKMMNLMFTYAIAGRLAGTGVSSIVFHPGIIKSDLMKEMPLVMRLILKIIGANPETVANMLCRLAIDPIYQNSSGKFYNSKGKELESSSYSYNKELQEELWTISEKLSK